MSKISGFSLGANIVTKYVGEEGVHCPLQGAAVLANPWDFRKGSNHIESGTYVNRVGYRFVLGGALQTLYTLHSPIFFSSPPGAFSLGHDELEAALEQKPVSLREIDDLITAPMFGYRDAMHYYDEISSFKFLENVSVPLLGINARDDPLVADLTLPISQVRI